MELAVSSENRLDKEATSGVGAAVVVIGLLASSFAVSAVEDEQRGASALAPLPVAETVFPTRLEASLDRVIVAPEAEGSDYKRTAFRHWVDHDGNGCDTRQEILMAENRNPPDAADCPVVEGEWFSLYDGVEVTDPSRLDIDHIVPLKEAWRSKASTWTTDQRREFANDLDEPLALLAVTASTNRSKSDRDPANWKPPDETTWCIYATTWINVKLKWSLTADSAEIAALETMLATC